MLPLAAWSQSFRRPFITCVCLGWGRRAEDRISPAGKEILNQLMLLLSMLHCVIVIRFNLYPCLKGWFFHIRLHHDGNSFYVLQSITSLKHLVSEWDNTHAERTQCWKLENLLQHSDFSYSITTSVSGNQSYCSITFMSPYLLILHGFTFVLTIHVSLMLLLTCSNNSTEEY